MACFAQIRIAQMPCYNKAPKKVCSPAPGYEVHNVRKPGIKAPYELVVLSSAHVIAREVSDVREGISGNEGEKRRVSMQRIVATALLPLLSSSLLSYAAECQWQSTMLSGTEAFSLYRHEEFDGAGSA